MKQAKLRSKQKQRLRVLARTNFISTDTNRKSKKLSLDLTSILKPKGKNLCIGGELRDEFFDHKPVLHWRQWRSPHGSFEEQLHANRLGTSRKQ